MTSDFCRGLCCEPRSQWLRFIPNDNKQGSGWENIWFQVYYKGLTKRKLRCLNSCESSALITSQFTLSCGSNRVPQSVPQKSPLIRWVHDKYVSQTKVCVCELTDAPRMKKMWTSDWWNSSSSYSSFLSSPNTSERERGMVVLIFSGEKWTWIWKLIIII